jgi:DNA-directed RNA polymerase subunit RPC12/RpoP
VKTEAVEATAEQEGNSEYWTCTVCGKYYSDAEGKNEIAKDSWIIPATGHVWDDGVITTEPTCTEPGVRTYTCTDCGKTRTEEVLPLGHSLVKTEAVDPTATEPGNSEYFHCLNCDKYFADAAGENEIEEDSWILPPTERLR